MPPSEEDVYRSRHLVRKVAELKDHALWKKLHAAIETKGFFADQAAALGGFEQTTEDLEQLLLPRAIEVEDWQRFLHYAQVAAHLRGLAEALGEEAILDALGRAGRFELAEALVTQLSGASRRARLRAVLAAALPRAGEAFGHQKKALENELEEASKEGAEAWCGALEGVARHLAPDLRARWPEWTGSLPEGPLRDRVWRAVAESFLDREDLEAPTLWRALGSIGAPQTLLEFLPQRLERLAPADPRPLVRRLVEKLGPREPSVLWRLVLPLASTVGGSGGEILRHLETELGPPPWSAELAEAGRRLWLRLPVEELEGLCCAIHDPLVAVALRVVALEGTDEPSGAAARQALSAVEALPGGPEQLHWALRLLAACVSAPPLELIGPVAAVVRHLARLRYAAAAEDLCRFLDLVAAVFPENLRRQVENVLWAPESDAATLRTLAREATQCGLLEELFKRAEEYAALVVETSAAGFELRREVLVTLAWRLCVSGGRLEPFEAARGRLLLEEEDALRTEVAQGLAGAGRRAEAAQIAGGITPGRSRLRTLLEVLPEEAESQRQALLTPQALYQAAADSTALRDELGALAALLEEPRKPEELARDHLDKVTSPGRRIEGLVDLSHHALDWQEEHFSRALQDRPAAVLPLKQALGVVESDLWLVRLTPELVDVGGRLGAAQAVAEVQEAWERLIGVEAVEWPAREEALVTLLARLSRRVSVAGGDKHLRRLLEWLARTPTAMAAGPGRDDLRRRWHRLFPWLAAVEAHLFTDSRGSWAARGFPPWRRRWEWLTPHQEQVLAVCFASRDDRLRWAASSGGGDGEEEQDLLWALVCLRTADAPEAVPGLVARLASPEERDRLGLLLLAGGWLPPEVGEALLPLLSEGQARRWGEVWLGLAAGPEDGAWRARWVRAVARLLSTSALDPSDPRTVPLRRRLWEVGSDWALTELAGAAPAALAAGGKEAGERVLRLFLNAHLAPRRGREAGQGSVEWRQAEEAVRRAMGLDPAGPMEGGPVEREGSDAAILDGDHTEEHDRSKGTGVEGPSRLDHVQQSWEQVAERGPRSSPWSRPLRETLGAPGFFFLLASMFFFIVLDAPFWPNLSAQSTTTIAATRLPALPVYLFLLLLSLTQAVLIDRFLAWRFIAEYHVYRWVRGLRFLLAGVPFLGLAVLPGWQILMQISPSWAVAAQPSRVSGALHLRSHDGTDSRSAHLRPRLPVERWMASSWALGLLFLASYFWIFLLAIPWAMGRALASPGGLDSLLLLSMSLHGIAFVVVAVSLGLRSHKLRLSEPQRGVYVALSVFWLLPYPVAALGGAMLWLFFEARVEREPLVGTAWSGGVGRLPVWRNLTLGLRRGWQLLPLPRRLRGRSERIDEHQGSRQVDRQLVWFYRGKAFALFLESAALSWGLQWLAELSGASSFRAAEASLGTLAQITLTLGTLGLAGMGGVQVRRLLRLSVRFGEVDGRRLAGFLAGTQLGFYAGLALGDGLWEGGADRVGGALMLAGLVGSVIYAGPLMLSMFVSFPEEEKERVWWALFYAAVGMAGMGLARPENAAQLQLLELLVRFGPPLAVIGAVARLGWFLRPAHPRQIFSTATPAPFRRRLIFLTATALMPLGGFFVPLWIWLRPRWWPDCELH